MPYRKRFRPRKFKRRYKSRRRFRRRTSKRYDGAIFSKIHYFKNVTVVDGGGGNHYAPMLVHWGILNQGMATAGEMYINDVAEYAQRINNKRDWRIYGIKMIWHPLGDI